MDRLKIKWLLLLVLLAASCAKNPTSPKYEKQIVIFGYLWGGKNLSQSHAILVNHTQPIEGSYQLQNARIPNAEVTLRDNASGQIWHLQEDQIRPGFYYNEKLKIQPETSYTIAVRAGEEYAEATTIVPPKIYSETSLSATEVNNVYFEELGFSKPIKIQCEDPDQIILLDIYCNEDWQNARYINNFGNQEGPQEKKEYDSGPFGQPRHLQVFMPYQDLQSDLFNGEHVIYWYNAMIVFYGSNTLQVLAIDENYHSFLYHEHSELNGGVKGGIGLLGSVCGEGYKLNVLEP